MLRAVLLMKLCDRVGGSGVEVLLSMLGGSCRFFLGVVEGALQRSLLDRGL